MQQDITGAIVFNGAYIQRFSATLGIGSTPTQIEMDLIEGSAAIGFDAATGATGFYKPAVLPGSVTGIKIGSFEFVGAVTAWQESYSAGGRVFNVRLSDPRLVLGNTVLGLDGLSPVINTPNYLNAFNFYGNPSSADSNERGMSFGKIRDYLTTSGRLNVYGREFSFIFSSGFQEVSGAINPTGIPAWYRVNGSIVSLDQCLDQVTNSLGMEYYAYSPYTSFNSSGVLPFRIQHIYRFDATGSINTTAIVSGWQSSGVVGSYTIGQELRNDPNIFVGIGPRQLFWSFPQANEIQKAWGRTDDGTIVTTEYDDTYGVVLLNHITGSGSNAITSTVTVPFIQLQKASGVNVYPPRITRVFTNQDIKGYEPTVNVMRAALYNQQSWEAMLYKEMPSFAAQLGITTQRFREQSLFVTSPDAARQAAKMTVISSGTLRTDVQEALISAVYDATRQTVDDNWGRSWLLQAGTSQWLATGSYDSSELYPRIEFEPADACWSENNSIPSGIGGNHPLLHSSSNPNFKNQVGCIKAFVSIPNYDSSIDVGFPYPLELEKIGRDDVLIETLNNKAVLPLASVAYDKDPDRFFVQTSIPLEGKTASSRFRDKRYYYDFLIEMGYSDSEIKKYNLMQGMGDNNDYGLAPPRLHKVPYSNEQYGFFLPVQSNVRTYGPFVASGTRACGVNVVNDDGLAPWTFGGYSKLSQAGTQYVNSVASLATVIDTAEINIVGLPIYNIGDPVGQSAYVAGISFQYGADGVSTKYVLKTFTYPAIRLSKLLYDRTTNVFNRILYTQREIVDLSKVLKFDIENNPLTSSDAVRELTNKYRKNNASIIGYNVPSPSGLYSDNFNPLRN
jgi:hypothetical protein